MVVSRDLPRPSSRPMMLGDERRHRRRSPPRRRRRFFATLLLGFGKRKKVVQKRPTPKRIPREYPTVGSDDDPPFSSSSSSRKFSDDDDDQKSSIFVASSRFKTRRMMRFENEEKRSNDGDEFKKKCTKKVPLKRRPRVRAHTPMILLRFGTENKTEAGSCANTRAHTTIQKNTFNDAWRFFWTRNAKK